ncbi:MAG: hypothetical protein R2792_14660 [Saprospiraceae bacterium]
MHSLRVRPGVHVLFGVSPEHYGWLFGLNVVGIAVVSFFNRFLVRKYELDFLLKRASFVAMLAGAVLTFLVYFEIGGILAIILPVLIFFSMNGIIAACTTAAALDKVPTMAGAGAALLGSLQYGSGILSTVLLAVFSHGDGQPWTMSWIIGLFALLSMLMAFSTDFIKEERVENPG